MLLIRVYMIETDSDFKLYPIEVEAYYHHPGFPDSCVHKNELQKIDLVNYTFTEVLRRRRIPSFMTEGVLMSVFPIATTITSVY